MRAHVPDLPGIRNEIRVNFTQASLTGGNLPAGDVRPLGSYSLTYSHPPDYRPEECGDNSSRAGAASNFTVFIQEVGCINVRRCDHKTRSRDQGSCFRIYPSFGNIHNLDNHRAWIFSSICPGVPEAASPIRLIVVVTYGHGLKPTLRHNSELLYIAPLVMTNSTFLIL